MNFIQNYLGKQFVQVPPINMMEAYEDSTKRTPIIFILTTGADPSSMLQRLSDTMEFGERMDVMSLGKGQGKKAKQLIRQA
mmetsp:Transcript_13246/g.2060  ORF Transcript_13246/g.2060 Transcript_13246/m.2060 type:complete len:81 (+) Transcript_13246:298-540(+)